MLYNQSTPSSSSPPSQLRNPEGRSCVGFKARISLLLIITAFCKAFVTLTVSTRCVRFARPLWLSCSHRVTSLSTHPLQGNRRRSSLSKPGSIAYSCTNSRKIRFKGGHVPLPPPVTISPSMPPSGVPGPRGPALYRGAPTPARGTEPPFAAALCRAPSGGCRTGSDVGHEA